MAVSFILNPFTGSFDAIDVITLGTPNGLSLAGDVLSLGLSSTSTTGALSSTDWNTFNGKQAAGSYITALTGDGTASGPGSATLTLATVNSNVGSFTNANITVNAKGLITAASNGTNGTVTSVSVVSANGLSGTVATATTTPAITLSTTATGVLLGNGTAISGLTIPATSALVSTSGSVASFTSGATANRVLRTDGTTITFDVLNLATDTTGVLAIGNGGTGHSSFTAHGVILGNASSALNVTAAGTAGQVLTSNGPTLDPTFQTVSTGLGVGARYEDTSGQSYTGGVETVFVTATPIYDTNSAFNTTTNTYTVPVGQDGLWHICVGANGGSVVQTAGGANFATVYKNGTLYAYLAYNNTETTGSYRMAIFGSGDVQVAAGDTLQVKLRFSVTDSLDTTTHVNSVTFTKY